MELLHTNEDFAVCRKPVGVDSEHQLPQLLEAALGAPVYPIHRLDRNVGGLMVYARTKAAAARLSQLVQSGELVKEYVALVHGRPPEEGQWQDLLFKDSRKNKVFVVNKQRSGVKEASLEFKRLSAGERSLVRIRLHTGRSHQIRVQFSSRGFPLVGDHKYGSRAKETAPMLYSCALTFSWKGKSLHFADMPLWAKMAQSAQCLQQIL